MTPSMDRPLRSQFMNEVPGPVSRPQSKLYSAWSVCEDDAGAPSVPGGHDTRTPPVFSDTEKCFDAYGTVQSLPEESNKPDTVTDWDLLSRLFPPLWPTNDHNEVTEYLPSPPGGVEFPNMDSFPASQDQARKLPDLESLQRGFQDLGLLESWVPSTDAYNPEIEVLLQNLYIENQPTEGPNQPITDYVQLNGKEFGTKEASIYPNTQKRAKENSGVPRPIWRSDKGRGKFNKTSPSQSNYSPTVREGWGKDIPPKPSNELTPLSIKPPSYHFTPQAFSKERGFQRKEGSTNYANFPNVRNVCENITPQIPTEPYAKSPVHIIHPNEGFHPSNQRHRWLESEISPTQKMATSPLPSPTSSSLSDGSPTHNPHYYPQASSLPLSTNEGQLSDMSSPRPYSGFSEESHRRNLSFGHSSPNKERVYRNTPSAYPSNWSPPQQTSERHQRLAKKPSPQNSGHSERRGRKSWTTQHGNVRQNPPPYNAFQKKQDPNMGNVSDFINASFLPPFSLMSELKQGQNFPSFSPPAYPPPTNMPFPPPIQFSDIIDLFHYEDLNHLHPFINDLFSEIPTPYFPFPAPINRYRTSRNRSGPASELHLQLEECCDQWRALEKERKKTEAELARNFPGNRISSSYTSSVPRLPANPSRVDRLMVDQFREQARAVSLVKIMERIRAQTLHVNISLALEHHLEAIHLTQARRKDEIVNAANRQKQGVPRYNNERDVLALAAAIKEMVSSTRKARTALWCALQITISKSSSGVAVKQEDIDRALQELCPTRTPGGVEVEESTDTGDLGRA